MRINSHDHEGRHQGLVCARRAFLRSVDAGASIQAAIESGWITFQNVTGECLGRDDRRRIAVMLTEAIIDHDGLAS